MFYSQVQGLEVVLVQVAEEVERVEELGRALVAEGVVLVQVVEGVVLVQVVEGVVLVQEPGLVLVLFPLYLLLNNLQRHITLYHH